MYEVLSTIKSNTKTLKSAVPHQVDEDDDKSLYRDSFRNAFKMKLRLN